MNITLQQLLAFDAIVSNGSIQAGASQLNKTHPTVLKALTNLEGQLDFLLFDRTGYRIILTEKGNAFYKSVKPILKDIETLKIQAKHLRLGEEPVLNIVLGDLTPKDQALQLLHSFSKQHSFTHLNLLFENLYGPNERLMQGDADLIIHHIDKSDPKYEYKDFCTVAVVPVIAPGFLVIPITKSLQYADLKAYKQCIIRDTAKQETNKSYFVNEESQHITVGDQHTKKQVILQSMAWGHMPLFLVQKELEDGDLLSIEGENIQGTKREIVIARLREKTKGVMLERLWECF